MQKGHSQLNSNSRNAPTRRAGALAVLAFLATGALPLAANAAEPVTRQSRVGVDYVVTWMGIPVVRGRIQTVFQANRYSVVLSSRTVGLAESLFRDRREVRVQGILSKKGPIPKSYSHRAKSRKENRVVTMTYRKDGTIDTSITPPESPGKRKPVPARLQANTLDPLSAMIAGTLLPVTETRCGFSAPVFDGRRRLDIQLTYRGRETTPVSFAGAPGQSVKCEARMKRIAGFRPRAIREHPNPPPIEVWSVRHAASGLWIPVRLRVKAGMSTVVARITKVTVDRP